MRRRDDRCVELARRVTRRAPTLEPIQIFTPRAVELRIEIEPRGPQRRQDRQPLRIIGGKRTFKIALWRGEIESSEGDTLAEPIGSVRELGGAVEAYDRRQVGAEERAKHIEFRDRGGEREMQAAQRERVLDCALKMQVGLRGRQHQVHRHQTGFRR